MIQTSSNEVNNMSEQHYQLAITGMKCQGCVSNVDKALNAVAGVKSAAVSLEQNSASVTGDVTAAELIKAIEDAGYKASEAQ
jgi:copper chaperone CopZ